MTDLDVLQQMAGRLKQQAKEADRKRLAAIDDEFSRNGEIRDKHLLLNICYSSEEFFENFVARHPGIHLFESIENINRAFSILKKSQIALVDLVGKIHARLLHDIWEDDDRDLTIDEATREVYTYSCASYSLVQAYRHFISSDPELERKYYAVRQEVLGESPIVKFFGDLRRNNNHIRILSAVPHYTVTNHFDGKPVEIKSGIKIDRASVLNSDEWTPLAKSFVREREDLQIADIVTEHFRLIARFKEVVFVRTGVTNDRRYRDLLRIKQARKVCGIKNTMAIILQVAVPKKVNPYEYLHRWFTPAELKNIFCFENHSVEQIEYMISLRDPFGFCDREIKTLLYKLFSVPLELIPDTPSNLRVLST